MWPRSPYGQRESGTSARSGNGSRPTRSRPDASADTVDPYFTGYQAAVDETARLGSLFLPAGERIQIYVAKKAKYTGRLHEIHDVMLALSPHQQRLPSAPGISTPQELVQLQAADFVAFEASRYQRGGEVRPEMLRLRRGHKWRVRYRPENRIFQGYIRQ